MGKFIKIQRVKYRSFHWYVFWLVRSFAIREVLGANQHFSGKSVWNAVKPVLSGHSKRRPKIGFQDTDYRWMQVKSIAECSKGSILQYFRPSSSNMYHLSIRSLFWCGSNFRLSFPQGCTVSLRFPCLRFICNMVRPEFFISWLTNPPTVIFRKVGKK